MRKEQLIIILIFLAFSIAVIIPSFAVWSSPKLQFNVTPEIVYINWTNASGLGAYSTNITITINQTVTNWFNVSVDNTSVLYYNYTSTPYTCALSTYGCARILVRNESGDYFNKTKNMTGGNSTQLVLVNDQSQSITAGRYFGTVTLYNTSDRNENATITVILDNPISIGSNGVGTFSGKLLAYANSSQRFYFNTSSISSATGILINISATADIDLFLFDDSGSLKEKSINKTSTSKNLIYNFLPATPVMWEIIIFGNSTSSIDYNGTIVFTTLNAVNTTGQRITLIDLGVINTTNITQMTQQQIIILNNTGSLNFTNVAESKELYLINRTSTSGSRNFTFTMPEYVTKIKVALNWTGGSNYSFFLYKPDGTLAANSMGKYVFANVSGAMQEEYNETATSSSDKGTWRIEVRNNTLEAATYGLTIYQYVRNTWISTNYTTSTFNMTGLNNSNYTIQLNFTIPNNTINGIYEGALYYRAESGIGTGIKIPIRINITSPILIVNGTYNSSIVQVDENINASLLRNISVEIRNDGIYNISSIPFTYANLTYGNYYMNLTLLQVPSYLNASSTSTINITVDISMSNTNDTAGIYQGWLLLNTSGSSYSVKPYDIFNISLRVNLTNLLDARITGLDTMETPNTWIYNTTSSKEIGIRYLNLYYVNRTQITGESIINSTSNITSVRLYQSNATYWVPNSTGTLVKTATATFEASSGNYQFNITVPANLPGGQYQVRVNATTTNGKLYGISENNILTVAGEGFYMNTSSGTSPSLSIANASSTTFTVFINNFGPNASSTTLIFNKGSCPITVAYSSCGVDSGSCSNPAGTNISFTSIPAYSYSNKYNATWTITGSGSGSCTANISGASKWFNSIPLSISVSATQPTTTTTTTTVTTTTTTTPAVGLKITSYPAETKIQQNTSKSVEIKVNNTGSSTLNNVKVYVDGIPLWYTVPDSQNIASANEKTYTLTFSIPAGAEVKTYDIKYIANNTNTSASADAKLIVTPSNETQKQIVVNLTDYTSKLEAVSKAINETKARGGNTSIAEEKLKQVEALISQANAYITLGDYNAAYALFSQIDSLLKDADAKLLEAKTQLEQQAGGFWLWVAIGIAAAVGIGFLVYMLIPPSHGYEPEVGFKYAPPQARGKAKASQIQQKIKEFIEKIKSKFKKKEQQGYAYQGKYQLEKE